jgi:hypothetical protein
MVGLMADGDGALLVLFDFAVCIVYILYSGTVGYLKE